MKWECFDTAEWPFASPRTYSFWFPLDVRQWHPCRHYFIDHKSKANQLNSWCILVSEVKANGCPRKSASYIDLMKNIESSCLLVLLLDPLLRFLRLLRPVLYLLATHWQSSLGARERSSSANQAEAAHMVNSKCYDHMLAFPVCHGHG